MKRVHRMPFGAECTNGGVRFRLWAPSARSVDLVLDGRPALAMTRSAEGWFDRVEKEAAPGTQYRFRIDGGQLVPDPASRSNPQDVHGPSEVIDPAVYSWRDGAWHGRPWHEAVLYEMHVGAFTAEGNFRAAAARLPYLRDLGVTAVELMPLADFPGARNWGYDGVLPFAPDSRYGRPDDLKALVDTAHQIGLMVFLDVVYNHFGPDGNYLHVYARDFFTDRHHTPWGAAINFDDAQSRTVRDFFIHNALYWIEEFHFDGLRLDAVHAIRDDSDPDILVELAQAVRSGPARDRHVHLVLENDDNAARYLAREAGNPRWYDAQWNDDFHHAMHVLITGETDGYYADYAAEPARLLARILAEGYAYQGEHSVLRGHPRGEPSRDLPPTAFVAFLQNHDQVGNRALGERLPALAPPRALDAALAVLLLAPSVPLLFMGEEFGCEQPFPFFCDYFGELARAVTEGRRNEFKAFARFHDEAARAAIPDPNDPETFIGARIDWARAESAAHGAPAARVRELLALRAARIVPRLPGLVAGGASFAVSGGTALLVRWPFADGGELTLAANLGHDAGALPAWPGGEVLCALPAGAVDAARHGGLPPWSVVWTLRPGAAQ